MRLSVVVLLPVAMVAMVAACESSPPDAREPSPSAPPARTVRPIEMDQRREAPLPEPLQEVASAASEKLGLWVLGGFDGRGRSSSAAYRYLDGKWGRQPDLPLVLNHPAAAALGDSVYVAGGYTDGNRASRRVFTMPGRRELPPLNHARGALALVAAGGKLYAIGGRDGDDHVGPAEEFVPATNRWSDLPPLPAPRDHVAGFAYRGMACIAGGRTPNTNKIHCWDPRGRRWITLPDLPAATSGAGGGTLGDRIVVAGGEDPGGGRMVDQLAVFTGGSWSATRMLVPRHGISLATYRDRLWACGGGTRAGLGAVPDCTSIA